MKIKVKKTDVYIPRFNGNDEEKEPIKVHFRFLTSAERSDYIAILPVKVKDGEPEIELKQDNAGMVRKMVKRIENLEIETEGKTVLIDDTEKLYNTEGVPFALIQEIEGALASASAAVDPVPLD